MKLLNFNQFINEAYLDQEGKLQDFEFNDEDRAMHSIYDEVNNIKDFLEDAGARNLRSDVIDGLVKIEFRYRGEHYSLHLDLDNDKGMIIYFPDPNRPEVIYDSSADSLASLLQAKGLDFL